jgi:hypothetical protein
VISGISPKVIAAREIITDKKVLREQEENKTGYIGIGTGRRVSCQWFYSATIKLGFHR